MSYKILSVEPTSEKNYRLALEHEDRQNLERKDVESLQISVDGKSFIEINRALTTYRDYGSLSCSEISKWIMENNYHDYEKGNPHKFIFNFSRSQDNVEHRYVIYQNQGVKK